MNQAAPAVRENTHRFAAGMRVAWDDPNKVVWLDLMEEAKRRHGLGPFQVVEVQTVGDQFGVGHAQSVQLENGNWFSGAYFKPMPKISKEVSNSGVGQ